MIRDIWLVIVIYIYHNTLYVLSGGPVELIEALRIFWQFFDDSLRFFGGFLAPCPLVRIDWGKFLSQSGCPDSSGSLRDPCVRIDFGGRPDKVPPYYPGSCLSRIVKDHMNN